MKKLFRNIRIGLYVFFWNTQYTWIGLGIATITFVTLYLICGNYLRENEIVWYLITMYIISCVAVIILLLPWQTGPFWFGSDSFRNKFEENK